MIVDLFAGGGGASCGIHAATGLPTDIAVNPDDIALKMFKRNPPETWTLPYDVFSVDPELTAWFDKIDLLDAEPAWRDRLTLRGLDHLNVAVA